MLCKHRNEIWSNYVLAAEAFAGCWHANGVENSFKWHWRVKLNDRDVVIVVGLRVARMFDDSLHLKLEFYSTKFINWSADAHPSSDCFRFGSRRTVVFEEPHRDSRRIEAMHAMCCRLPWMRWKLFNTLRKEIFFNSLEKRFQWLIGVTIDLKGVMWSLTQNVLIVDERRSTVEAIRVEQHRHPRILTVHRSEMWLAKVVNVIPNCSYFIPVSLPPTIRLLLIFPQWHSAQFSGGVSGGDGVVVVIPKTYWSHWRKGFRSSLLIWRPSIHLWYDEMLMLGSIKLSSFSDFK